MFPKHLGGLMFRYGGRADPHYLRALKGMNTRWGDTGQRTTMRTGDLGAKLNGLTDVRRIHLNVTPVGMDKFCVVA
jgi:hypothetical protein